MLSNTAFANCTPGELVPVDNVDPHIFENLPAPDSPDSIPSWEIGLKITFYAFAFILAVFGNSMVIGIVIVNKRMRTTTNCLILNLAVSDLLVGLFCMWVHAGNRITTQWPFGPVVCKASTFVQVMTLTASVLTLTLISIERFIAITFPLKSKMSPQTVSVTVAITWVLSTAVASPHLAVRRQFEFYWADLHEIWCAEEWPEYYIDSECNTDGNGKRIYYTIGGIVMYFVPIGVMIVTYSIIGLKVIVRKPPGVSVASTTATQERSKRKVMRMLFGVVVAFIVCWTPQHVLLLWDVYRPREKLPANIEIVKYIAVYVAYLNSAVNPILYGALNENFRRGFKEAFKCHLCQKRNAVSPVERLRV